MARCEPLARLLFAVTLIAARHAGAATGQLDPSFGTAGVVSTTVNSRTYVWDAILQPDGRIVVAGVTLPSAAGATNDVLLARYTADGALDASFGTGGIVVTHVPDIDTSSVFVVCNPDGSYFVADNRADYPSFEALLLRYLPDGTLDTSFDGDGILPLAPIRYVYGLALRPDGRLVIFGDEINGIHLEQRQQDGSFDGTFGTGGVVTDSVPPYVDSVALRSDGKLLLAGATTGFQTFFVRYDANGSRDLGFGSGGMVLESHSASGVAANLDATDRILVAEYNRAPFLIRRYDAEAVPDPTFAGGLPVATQFPFPGARSLGAVADAAGRVVAWGEDSDGSSEPYVGLLARYRPTGELDPSFAGGKVVVPDVHFIRKVFERSDGKLVLVGSEPPNEIELARYEGTCPPGPDVDGDGLPDDCDPCIGPTLTHVSLDITNTLPPAGNERLAIRARIDAPGVPPLDLIARGALLQIEDATRAAVQTVYLLPGAVESDPFKIGWKARGRGFRYYNVDILDSESWVDGVYRFTVTVNAQGELRLRVKATDGSYPVDPSHLPLRMAIVFAPPHSAGGECGEIAFASGQCTFDAVRGRVRCR